MAIGFVTTATFDVLVPRSPLFPLSYLWDLHSVWGSPNRGMQCKYPETRATWEAVPMWHDVMWSGSSLSFGSGVTILSPLLYQEKHNLLRTELMEPCYLVALLNFQCIRKNKAKIVQLTFFEGRSEALTENFVHLHETSTWKIFNFLKFLVFLYISHNCMQLFCMRAKYYISWNWREGDY